MKQLFVYSIFGLIVSLSLTAFSFPSPQFSALDQPWSIAASIGNGTYQAAAEERSIVYARLALGNELLLAGDIALGLELGLQTGTKLYIISSHKNFNLLSWYPIQTTLSPTIDLLATTKTDPLWNSSLYAQLKGGIALRHWKMDMVSLSQITQLAGEIQAGFGYPITSITNLNLLYLGIYGSKPNLIGDVYADRLFNIPTLHSFLIGLSVNL